MTRAAIPRCRECEERLTNGRCEACENTRPVPMTYHEMRTWAYYVQRAMYRIGDLASAMSETSSRRFWWLIWKRKARW